MVGGFVLSELFTKLISTSRAVLLFSKNIDEYPDFRLRMARFVGTDKNMFRDNQRAEGNFFELLQAGIDFCFKHLSLSGRITNIKESHESFPHNLNVAEALFRMTYYMHRRSEAFFNVRLTGILIVKVSDYSVIS